MKLQSLHFLERHEMVDNPSTNQIISWSPRQCSFVVWDPTEFSKELLPKCFRHSNFFSFIRQLNTYGFKKIDPARWEFANDDFIKDRRDLLKNIHSRKLVHNHSVQVIQELRRLSVPGSTHSEKRKLEEYAESLKHEKRLLLLEIQRQTMEHQKIKLRLQSLEYRLHQMEYLQQKTVAAFAQTLQTPDYCAFDFTHKRRRLSTSKDNSFNNVSVGLLCNNAHARGETLMSEIGSAVQNAGPSEINTLHGDPQSSLHSALPYPQAMVCSFDSMQLNADMEGDNSLGNGLSSNQTDVHEVLAWKEKSEGVGNSTLINVQAQDDGVNNDLFWEQVLVETLGSSCDLHQFLGTSDVQNYP